MSSTSINGVGRMSSTGGSSAFNGAPGRRRSQVGTGAILDDGQGLPDIDGTGGHRRGSITQTFHAASPSNLGGRSIVATGDPNHHRQPSLGDIHNELEQEQEAQVNRMLTMIRHQQQQLDSIRAAQGGTVQANGIAVEDSTTPQSERSHSFPAVHPMVGTLPRPGRISREPSLSQRSPGLRPLPSHESAEHWPPSPSVSSARGDSTSRRSSVRDESTYFQAETSNLQRENQMLRARIRELESKLQERDPAQTAAAATNSSGTRSFH